MTDLRTRLDALRTSTPSYDDHEQLWADCPPVRAADVLGSWAGSDFGPGHPVHEMLATSGWHGKRFESIHKAHPLICRGADGELFSKPSSARASRRCGTSSSAAR